MQIEKLKEWAEALERDSQGIRGQIHSLGADLQRKTQQIELIRKLIDSASGAKRSDLREAGSSNVGPPASPVVTPSEVKDHVYEILADLKRPMNINEIHSEFRRRGYIIPGKGTAFNILVHIGRELKLGRRSRFYRTGRGTYALRDHQPNSKA